jgi:hypothetical protein
MWRTRPAHGSATGCNRRGRPARSSPLQAPDKPPNECETSESPTECDVLPNVLAAARCRIGPSDRIRTGIRHQLAVERFEVLP